MKIGDVYINQSVIVDCPVFRRGRKLKGRITGIKSELAVYVRISGNIRSTAISLRWLTPQYAKREDDYVLAAIERDVDGESARILQGLNHNNVEALIFFKT